MMSSRGSEEVENFNTLQISFCHMSCTKWICKKLTHDCPEDAKPSLAQIAL